MFIIFFSTIAISFFFLSIFPNISEVFRNSSDLWKSSYFLFPSLISLSMISFSSLNSESITCFVFLSLIFSDNKSKSPLHFIQEFISELREEKEIIDKEIKEGKRKYED